MSIALPFNRLSASASGHAGRVARSSSWLNKPRDVRRDVQALFQALEAAPRSVDNSAVATSDACPQAGSPHASTSNSPGVYLGDRTGPSSAWKGKGRALPVDEDARATRNSANEYLEEGSIERPISTFFDTNTQSDTTSSLSPTVSASKSKTSTKKPRAKYSMREIRKRAALKAFLAKHTLPETVLAARTLVNRIASQSQPLGKMNILLEFLPQCPPHVEIAALMDCLAFPVMPHADWNLRVLDDARSQVYNKGYTGPRVVIDDVTFYKVWTRLCDLAGDNLVLSPEVAVRTLKRIITLPSPKKMMRQPEAYRVGKPLRRLLFLAGLEDNPTLAVNILAQTIHPNIFCAAHLLAAAQLEPEQVANMQEPAPIPEVNDIVLILQDLLRSGILSPSVVNRFGLSEAISKAPSMPTTNFESLLKQTLLRIILQYYIDHGEQRYIANIAQALEPVAVGGPTEAHTVQERDATLLMDCAKTMLQHLRYDMREAGATARTFTQLLEIIPEGMAQTDFKDIDTSVSIADLRRLLSDYFKIVLEPGVEEVEDATIGTALLRLWTAASSRGILNADKEPFLSVSQMARLLENIALPADAASLALLFDTARELVERVQAEINSGHMVDNDVANTVLNGVVHACQLDTLNQAEHTNLVHEIYHVLLRPNAVHGGFSLQSQTLRPLVQYMKKWQTPATGEEQETRALSGSAVIDHFMRTRGSWKVVPHADYTALAGALLDNGEPLASNQVIKQIFDRKEVPSLEDVEICLKILARRHRREARQIVQNALKEGLLAAPDMT